MGRGVPVLISAGLLNQKRPPWLALVVDLRGATSRRIWPPVSRTRASRPMRSGRQTVPRCGKFCGRSNSVAPTDTASCCWRKTGTQGGNRTRYLRDERATPSPFVKVNCAAIPGRIAGKRAFRLRKRCFHGAHCRKIGRLELAHHGTLFLDEVGDIPWNSNPSSYACSRSRNLSAWAGRRL